MYNRSVTHSLKWATYELRLLFCEFVWRNVSKVLMRSPIIIITRHFLHICQGEKNCALGSSSTPISESRLVKSISSEGCTKSLAQSPCILHNSILAFRDEYQCLTGNQSRIICYVKVCKINLQMF